MKIKNTAALVLGLSLTMPACTVYAESLNNADQVNLRTGLLKVTQPDDPAGDEIITLNGVKLQLSKDVQGNPNTSISYHYSTPDSDYVLLSLSQNAEACPVQYSWMKIARNSYGYSPVFGTCTDGIAVQVSAGKLIIKMAGYLAPSMINTNMVTKAQLREAKKTHTYVFDTTTGKLTDNGKPITN